jgi:hypothetical protein
MYAVKPTPRFFFGSRRHDLLADGTEHQRDPLISAAPPRLIKSARYWTSQKLPDAAGGNAKQS